MINYEEEIAKFQPSLEIDEAEEAILHNDLTDISDIIELIVKSGNKQKERGKIQFCNTEFCPTWAGIFTPYTTENEEDYYELSEVWP